MLGRVDDHLVRPVAGSGDQQVGVAARARRAARRSAVAGGRLQQRELVRAPRARASPACRAARPPAAAPTSLAASSSRGPRRAGTARAPRRAPLRTAAKLNGPVRPGRGQHRPQTRQRVDPSSGAMATQSGGGVRPRLGACWWPPRTGVKRSIGTREDRGRVVLRADLEQGLQEAQLDRRPAACRSLRRPEPACPRPGTRPRRR